MSKKMKLFIAVETIVAVFFLAIYIFVSNYYSVERKKSDIAVQNTVQKEKVNDDVKINLYEEGTEREYTLKEIKDKLDIKKDLEESELVKLMESKGYKFDCFENDKFMFTKNEDGQIEKDRYYIGEKDGYIAIYKSDEKGQLFIEDEESDVYSQFRALKTLRNDDREKIKNLEFSYDNKEEAEEGVSEFIS